jgi:threonyl-tRNA synthetase
MKMAKVKLPDNSILEVPDGTSAAQVAEQIGGRLAAAAVAAQVDGTAVDLAHPLCGEVTLRVLTGKDREALEVLRHSTAHAMAQAVGRLYGKDVQYAIGPPLMDDFQYGFYYDFDLPEALTAEDLPKIEAEMRKIAEEAIGIERFELGIEEAKTFVKARGQAYKVEMIEDLAAAGESRVSFYRQGDFVDLCRGPHLPDTGRLAHFKLLTTAGAYWRGDARRRMLTRIYGVAFFKKAELEAHVEKLKRARRQDHRLLGRQLELFSVHEEIGPGLIHWHPAGATVRRLVEGFWLDEHLRRGYQQVYTPHIASERIYQISGHLANYAELMYSPMDIDGQAYRIKPMNCPGHIKIFQTRPRSYRELPLRMCELGTVYRYEPSGTLHGMLRVRGFTQDDSHIFCTQQQLAGEVAGVLELVDYMMDSFGYTYSLYLATRPAKSLGTDAEWQWSTDALIEALARHGRPYEVDEGGGVFYAPKIDVKLRDSLGREWQGPTIQVDLNLPKRFACVYIGPDNTEHECVIVHRTVLGSMERFVGGLIEHYGGAFPLWLAPEQVRVLTVSERFNEYGESVASSLRAADLRVGVDLSADKIGAKIRAAAVMKVPYMLVCGGREAEAGNVAVRARSAGDLGPMALEAFLQKARDEIAERSRGMLRTAGVDAGN